MQKIRLISIVIIFITSLSNTLHAENIVTKQTSKPFISEIKLDIKILKLYKSFFQDISKILKKTIELKSYQMEHKIADAKAIIMTCDFLVLNIENIDNILDFFSSAVQLIGPSLFGSNLKKETKGLITCEIAARNTECMPLILANMKAAIILFNKFIVPYDFNNNKYVLREGKLAEQDKLKKIIEKFEKNKYSKMRLDKLAETFTLMIKSISDEKTYELFNASIPFLGTKEVAFDEYSYANNSNSQKCYYSKILMVCEVFKNILVKYIKETGLRQEIANSEGILDLAENYAKNNYNNQQPTNVSPQNDYYQQLTNISPQNDYMYQENNYNNQQGINFPPQNDYYPQENNDDNLI